MEGKDAIIQKIIGDANAQAQNMISDANSYAEKIIAEAEANAKLRVAEVEKQAEKAGVEYVGRRVTVAGLDLKKARLNAKMQLLDEVYDKAADELASLKPDEYKKLITGMLKVAAEDGDTVTVCKNDDKVLTQAFFDDFAKKKGIKLTLSKSFGDFKGGIILSGGGVDKNLTLEVELKLLREQTEAEIAAVLFKEV